MLFQDLRSFRDLIDFLDQQDLPSSRKRDTLSAIFRTCDMLGRSPESVPLDTSELRRLLQTIRPAAHSISPKSLSNIRSLISSALVLSGHLDEAQRGLAKQHPEWRGLLSAVLAHKDLSSGLAAFANRCASKGIKPQEVTDRTVQDFLVWLEKRTLHRKPHELARRIPNLWQKARAQVEQWPQTKLARLSFRPPSSRLTWAELPQSFRVDTEAYIAKRENPDIFDDSARVPKRPLAEGTLRQQREHLRLAASILIKVKGIPAVEIKSLADLLEPEAFKAILRYYHREKANGRPNGFVTSLSKTLIQVARYHNGVDDTGIELLKKLAGRLPDVPFDLTEKNKSLLRQLEPKEARAKLLFLPERLSNEVAAEWKTGRFRMVDAQCAIAIDILLAVPLRPQNLIALHWQRHFQEIDASGRLLLHIPAAETKTKKKDHVAEIPEDVARKIRWYRRVVLPRLGGDPNGYLFVTRGGARKHQKTLTIQIIGCIARHVGIHMTPHQFRHFAAVSYLEENPEDFETPRALLGHAFGKTTRVYAGSSTRRAGRAYGGFLFASRDKLRLQQRIQPRRRTPRNKGA